MTLSGTVKANVLAGLVSATYLNWQARGKPCWLTRKNYLLRQWSIDSSKSHRMSRSATSCAAPKGAPRAKSTRSSNTSASGARVSDTGLSVLGQGIRLRHLRQHHRRHHYAIPGPPAPMTASAPPNEPVGLSWLFIQIYIAKVIHPIRISNIGAVTPFSVVIFDDAGVKRRRIVFRQPKGTR